MGHIRRLILRARAQQEPKSYGSELCHGKVVQGDAVEASADVPEALFDFQRTTGVVATITNKEGGSKSGKLAEALSGDKKIVVCTIQTFPFALEAVRELAATEGKCFAVIADEAHSSQTGEAAAKLFKADMGSFVRLYTFLSQIYDYGNTAIEKRAIFYKRLIPLLEFGREREQIDVSKIVLTHHHLKDLGKQAMPLGGGETPKLDPITEAGSGSLQDKEKAYLSEIIEKVNDLFEGDLSDQDKLVYVNNVIKGKLLESETLRQQAVNNTKEQFANSPDLKTELVNAIMGALDAHNAMSTQALGSQQVQQGLKDVLLNNAGLYESLRSAE